jgi:hypothetical protein
MIRAQLEPCGGFLTSPTGRSWLLGMQRGAEPNEGSGTNKWILSFGVAFRDG